MTGLIGCFPLVLSLSKEAENMGNHEVSLDQDC